MAVRTVQVARDDSVSYICQWFAGKKLDQGAFPEESLAKAVAAPAISMPPAGGEKQ